MQDVKFSNAFPDDPWVKDFDGDGDKALAEAAKTIRWVILKQY